jgi:aspartate racemase
MKTFDFTCQGNFTPPLFGVLGGIGPVASSQFMKTVYEYCMSPGLEEQDYPRIILFSDSSIPNRMQALKNGMHSHVISKFDEIILKLIDLHVTQVIICCVTAHIYVDQLCSKAQSVVVSLVDMLKNEMTNNNGKSLVVSSPAVKEFNLINHDKTIYPDNNDSRCIKEFIQKIKTDCSSEVCYDFFLYTNELAIKYDVSSLIFACTELHVLHSIIKDRKWPLQYKILDPLDLAAKYIRVNHQRSMLNVLKDRNRDTISL